MLENWEFNDQLQTRDEFRRKMSNCWVSQLADDIVLRAWTKFWPKSQYAPLFAYVTFFRPRQNSTIQTIEANSMTAVAAHVMPKNLLPLYAAMPMSEPYLLTASTALTITAVEMAEAMPRVRNASCLVLASREDKKAKGKAADPVLQHVAHCRESTPSHFSCGFGVQRTHHIQHKVHRSRDPAIC
jgi:hypothetical protein